MGYDLFFALLSRSRGSLALDVRLNSPTYAEPFVAPSRTGRYARQKTSSVLASFRRGDTYDHIRRARSARMIYFLSESRTRAEPQDEYFLTRYLGSRRIDEYLERSKLGTKGYELLSSGRVKSVLIDGKRLV